MCTYIQCSVCMQSFFFSFYFFTASWYFTVCSHMSVQSKSVGMRWFLKKQEATWQTSRMRSNVVLKKIFVPGQCVCVQLFGQVKWRLNVVHQQLNNVSSPGGQNLASWVSFLSALVHPNCYPNIPSAACFMCIPDTPFLRFCQSTVALPFALPVVLFLLL